MRRTALLHVAEGGGEKEAATYAIYQAPKKEAPYAEYYTAAYTYYLKESTKQDALKSTLIHIKGTQEATDHHAGHRCICNKGLIKCNIFLGKPELSPQNFIDPIPCT